MNWSFYWRVKKKHTAKSLCFCFDEIDSFNMFNKYKEGLKLVKNSKDRHILSIFRYNLIVKLMDNDSLSVSSNAESYIIPVEKRPCNYGGFYYFFHCPQCDKRMRKLYLLEGKYLCRKCANLGYYSQRLRPSERLKHMKFRVKKSLENQLGSLNIKPLWKKEYTFQKLRKKYLDYDEKYFYAGLKELREWYGPKVDMYLGNHFLPDSFYDLYDFYK